MTSSRPRSRCGWCARPARSARPGTSRRGCWPMSRSTARSAWCRSPAMLSTSCSAPICAMCGCSSAGWRSSRGNRPDRRSKQKPPDLVRGLFVGERKRLRRVGVGVGGGRAGADGAAAGTLRSHRACGCRSGRSGLPRPADRRRSTNPPAALPSQSARLRPRCRSGDRQSQPASSCGWRQGTVRRRY